MTDSPFLPGTNIQFAFDSTSLGYLKTCPRLYQYHMIEGYQTKEESVHLRFGIEYHHALQDYDLSLSAGIKHDDAVHDVVRELLLRTGDFDPDHKTKTRENLVRTVIWYLDQYKHDKAETLILNGKPAVELSFRFELDYGPTTAQTQPYLLCGHLDRVVDFLGEPYVMDHKTAAGAPSSWYFTQYEPDNQMSLYALAGKVILNSPVKGVIIDAAQIKEDESIFGRGFTFRTSDQLDEWLRDLRFWLALAEQYALANYWPQNDKACNNYRSAASEHKGCPFRDICSKNPSVRETFLQGNFIKQPPEARWNPLLTR